MRTRAIVYAKHGIEFQRLIEHLIGQWIVVILSNLSLEIAHIFSITRFNQVIEVTFLSIKVFLIEITA